MVLPTLSTHLPGRRYPREVPPLPWYRRTAPQMAMAGFLPFSAIYIELYYIFASVWGHKARPLGRPLATCSTHVPSLSSTSKSGFRVQARAAPPSDALYTLDWQQQ